MFFFRLQIDFWELRIFDASYLVWREFNGILFLVRSSSKHIWWNLKQTNRFEFAWMFHFVKFVRNALIWQQTLRSSSMRLFELKILKKQKKRRTRKKRLLHEEVEKTWVMSNTIVFACSNELTFRRFKVVSSTQLYEVILIASFVGKLIKNCWRRRFRIFILNVMYGCQSATNTVTIGSLHRLNFIMQKSPLDLNIWREYDSGCFVQLLCMFFNSVKSIGILTTLTKSHDPCRIQLNTTKTYLTELLEWKNCRNIVWDFCVFTFHFKKTPIPFECRRADFHDFTKRATHCGALQRK